MDAQPSNESGGILVLVTGSLLVCPQKPCLQTPGSLIRCATALGRRGTTANELHANLPITARWRGELFRFQRCISSCLWAFLAACKSYHQKALDERQRKLRYNPALGSEDSQIRRFTSLSLFCAFFLAPEPFLDMFQEFVQIHEV